MSRLRGSGISLSLFLAFCFSLTLHGKHASSFGLQSTYTGFNMWKRMILYSAGQMRCLIEFNKWFLEQATAYGMIKFVDALSCIVTLYIFAEPLHKIHPTSRHFSQFRVVFPIFTQMPTSWKETLFSEPGLRSPDCELCRRRIEGCSICRCCICSCCCCSCCCSWCRWWWW